MISIKSMKRYQECNRIEKIWRCRWYILAPFIFIWKYFKKVKVYDHDNPEEYFHADARLIWSFVIGNLQYNKINYYWTSEEVFSKFDLDK